MGHFDGKVAVVTGGGRGIGREEARLLACEGACVVVNDAGGASDGSTGESAATGPAQALVDEISQTGGRAVASTHDVSDWRGAEALVNLAIEAFGGLDVVINNAGILRDRISFNMAEDEWDHVIKVHLKGHFGVARHAAAYWRARAKETGRAARAALVNTTSESGLYGNPGQANYAAAKAGIAALTLVLARELDRYGVRVNAIAPVARTRLTEPVAGDLMKPDPSGFDRFDPANVAAVAVWLASDASEGISGQVLKVQGGVIQLLEGWHVATETNAAEPWTLESVGRRCGQILGPNAGAIPKLPFR